MKIIITESQYKRFKHLLEQSVYDEEDYDSNEDYSNGDYDTKEGRVVKGKIGKYPIKFKYNYEDVIDGGKVDYYGDIFFNDKQYYGYLTTDKRGYLIELDFPVDSYIVDSSEGEPDTLQVVLKKMGLYYDFDNWLSEEVIPTINH